MTGIEIVLVIIGFTCTCVSFFVARKQENEKPEGEDSVRTTEVWTEREEEMIRERVNFILSDRQNELVDLTEEQLNRICNEKIMAIDEFSKPLLEKIENNHQEVIFMYNMLNEKEKDIKKIMTEPVKAPEPAKAPEPVKAPELVKAPEPVKTSEPVHATEPVRSPEPVKRSEHVSAAEVKRSPQASEENVQDIGMGGGKTQSQSKPKAAASTEQPQSKMSGSVNLQIQKMYKAGKSILEISKELNIGQGEVKLVIALYGDK